MPKIIISEQKFNQLWHKYRKDPTINTKGVLLNSNIQSSVTWNGEELKQSDILKNLEKQAKEEIKRVNNFIDLSLYSRSLKKL